jgi:HEAT repeat protein
MHETLRRRLGVALKDPDWSVRRSAAMRWQKWGRMPPEAVPALAAALKDPDQDVRQRAADVLGKIGPNARG